MVATNYNEEQVSVFDQSFFTNIGRVRRERLAHILQIDGGYNYVKSDFTCAYYFHTSEVWHFINSQGRHIISKTLLHSIGNRIDAQAELDAQLKQDATFQLMTDYYNRTIR